MALAERAAADVLAAQADRKALAQQRPERQMLGGRPVDLVAALDRLAALPDDPLELAVHVQALGHRGHREADLAEQLVGTAVLPRSYSSGAWLRPRQAPSSQSALFIL